MSWILVGLWGLLVASVAANLFQLLTLVKLTGMHRVSWWKAPAFPNQANYLDHSNHIDAKTGVDHWQGRWDDHAGQKGRVDAAEAVTDQNRPCWGHWTDYPVLD